jgi:arylsulfatase
MGNWKLVSLYSRPKSDYTPWELYDIDADRSELNDLASQMPERVTDMESAWMAWAKKVGWVPWNELNA